MCAFACALMKRRNFANFHHCDGFHDRWLLIKRFRQCLRTLVWPALQRERLGYPARYPRTRRRGIYLCGLSA